MRHITAVLAIGMLGVWIISGSAAMAGDARTPAGMEVPKGVGMTAVATRTSGRAGDLFAVDVYLSNIADLGAYQIKLKATGGAAGSLVLEDMAMDTNRKGYVFGAHTVHNMVDRNGWRVGSVKERGGVAVGKPGYAATFLFRASSEAKGTFTITIEKGAASSMMTNSGAVDIPFELGKSATITVGAVKRSKTDR